VHQGCCGSAERGRYCRVVVHYRAAKRREPKVFSSSEPTAAPDVMDDPHGSDSTDDVSRGRARSGGRRRDERNHHSARNYSIGLLDEALRYDAELAAVVIWFTPSGCWVIGGLRLSVNRPVLLHVQSPQH